MVYYGMEERLLLDADKAEAEHAKFQPKMDRLKASFVGSPLAIARIVCSVLPVAGLFLPLAKFAFKAPYAAFDGSVNFISIINLLSGRMDFDALIAMLQSKLFGLPFGLYAASIICVLLSAVGVLLHLILQTLACSPKGKQRNFALDILNLLLIAGSVVCFSVFSGKIMGLFPGVVTHSSVGFGAFVYLGLLAVAFGVDILCVVKGVPFKYKECFVGNIPADEYFKLVENGATLDEIRVVMAQHTKAKQEAEKAEKEKAEKEAAVAAADQTGSE